MYVTTLESLPRPGRRGRTFHNTTRLFLLHLKDVAIQVTKSRIIPSHLARGHDQRGGFLVGLDG